MLHSTIEASKNWSSLLTRVGFGTLALIVGAWLFDLPPLLSSELMTTSEFTLGFVVLAILWFLASMLLGAIVVMLGAFGGASQFSELSRTRRAHRVGQTGNTLLAELLRDANLKYDIAAGFFGLMYFAAVLAFTVWITRSGGGPNADAAQTLSVQSWNVVVFGGLGGLTSLWIRRSATSSIVAIDQVLSEVLSEPEETTSAAPEAQSLSTEPASEEP